MIQLTEENSLDYTDKFWYTAGFNIYFYKQNGTGVRTSEELRCLIYHNETQQTLAVMQTFETGDDFYYIVDPSKIRPISSPRCKTESESLAEKILNQCLDAMETDEFDETGGQVLSESDLRRIFAENGVKQ